MKIERVYDYFKGAVDVYRCPVCGAGVVLERPASMVCEKGHCFDISEYGDINFIPNQRKTIYEKELFESRRIIFEQGYYEPLAGALVKLLKGISGDNKKLRILDAGCGEGYYDGFLKERMPDAEVYPFDNAKEAIRMGAGRYKGINWGVGNLADLPVKDQVIDVVLEIFAPSNYHEFIRILKADGHLLKVIPGDCYLQELRAEIASEEGQGSYSSQPVEEHLRKHMELERRVEVSYTKDVDAEMLEHFLKMTPLMFGKDTTVIDKTRIKKITFEFVLLLGRKL